MNAGDKKEYNRCGSSLSRKGRTDTEIMTKNIMMVVAASRSEVRNTSEKRVRRGEA